MTTHRPAPLSSFDSDSDSDSDSDTSPTAAYLRDTDLSATIFRSYLESPAAPRRTSPRSSPSSPPPAPAPYRASMPRAHPAFQSDLVLRRTVLRRLPPPLPPGPGPPVLLLAASLWNCPKCRIEYPKTLIPKPYLCFCQKLVDPWILPHSCGEICNRPLNRNCGHHCLLLCHPGPCPSCPKLVKSRCFCGGGAGSRISRAMELVPNCWIVGPTGAGKIATRGECQPCRARCVCVCVCTGARVEGWRRRESVVTGVSGVRWPVRGCLGLGC